MAEVFDAGSFLSDQGFELLGPAEKPGAFKVLDENGDEGEFDVASFLKDQGRDPATFDIEANDLNSPIEVSPVGIFDRAKLSLGNAKGQISYLKQKFPDATFNENGDLVVKNNGVWQRVDPSGLGDGSGWEATKELIKDAVDLTDVGINTIPQILAAGSTGGTSALAAGSIAGLSKAVQTSLGRIVGTYEATAEEQIVDSALDAVITFGGTKVINGLSQSVWPAIKAGFKSFGAKAAPAVKEQIAGGIAASSGIRDYNVLRAFDRTDEVANQLKTAIKMAGPSSTYETIETVTKERSIGMAKAILEDGQKALSKTYLKQIDDFAKTVPGSIKTKDLTQTFATFLGGLAEAGLVTPQLSSKTGKVIGFSPVSPSRLAKLYANAGLDEITAKGVSRDVAGFVKSINNLKVKPATGGKAVKNVMEVKRALNEFYYNLVDDKPYMERLLTPFTKQFKVDLLNGFEDVTGNQLNVANVIGGIKGIDDFYSQAKPSVLQANKILGAAGRGTPETLEAFANKLYSDPANHRNAKDLIGTLSKLKGGSFKQVEDSLFDNIAAADFVRLAPRKSPIEGQIVNGLRFMVPLALGATVNPAVGVAAVAGQSPRLALRGIQAAQATRKAFGLLKSTVSQLPVSERFRLLQEPNVATSLFQQAWQAGQTDETAEQLIKEATGQ